MPLDGLFLHTVKNEITSRALNARVDKIHQPTRDIIIINLRGSNENLKLLISAGPGTARVGFTSMSLENPAVPPMFCTILRKHIAGGRLTGVTQQGLDRVVYLEFEATSELGDRVSLTLACEIMTRRANCVLINKDGIIIDALKRLNALESGERTILPGAIYAPMKGQDKLDILQTPNDEIIRKLQNYTDLEADKAVLKTIDGMSPLVSREIGGIDKAETSDKTDSAYWNPRLDLLKIRMENPVFTMLLDENLPKDFSFMPIYQYGATFTAKEYPTASELMDQFFSQKDEQEQLRQRSGHLLKFLKSRIERASRKLETQKLELEQSKDRDKYRLYGDLINTNLHELHRGQAMARLINYYDENLSEIEISLDIRLTPSQNAQKYYSEYKKAVKAEQILIEQIAAGIIETEYLESVYDAALRSRSRSELEEINSELSIGGYLKKQNNKREKKPKPLDCLKFVSPDGFTILCGRNNIQNDNLTMRTAKPRDIWCHVKDFPGSHVVIFTEGREVPDSTLEMALRIAAANSKARDSINVPVNYTYIKNVKKPGGAKPGHVIFTDYKTVMVTPYNEE